MDKRNKRRGSKASYSRSKNIVHLFADCSTVDRINERFAKKSRRLENSTISSTNMDDGKFITSCKFLKNGCFLFPHQL